MRYTVFMLQEAEFDLEAIFRYILDSGNPAAAKDLIRLIKKTRPGAYAPALFF